MRGKHAEIPAMDLKTARGVSPSWVRIPPLPPTGHSPWFAVVQMTLALASQNDSAQTLRHLILTPTWELRDDPRRSDVRKNMLIAKSRRLAQENAKATSTIS